MSDNTMILATVGAVLGAVAVLGVLGYREYKRDISEEAATREPQSATASYTDMPGAVIPFATATRANAVGPDPTIIATPVNGGKGRKSKGRKTNKKNKSAKRRR
jgi:hypothetical protein